MKKKLEDYSCFIKRITGAFSLKSIHRYAKVTMLSFFTLVAMPCVSFAQTPPKDIRNAGDLTDAFKPANVDSWNQLNITADIPSKATPSPNGNGIFEFKRGTTGGSILDRTISGLGGMRILSYTDNNDNPGAAAAGGRLFHYDATNVGNTTISNLEFKWGNLERNANHSIGGGAVFQNFTTGTVSIENSLFKNNTAKATSGAVLMDAGAGGAYFNGMSGTATASGQAVHLINTSFEGNKVINDSSTAGGTAYGGGAVIADVAEVLIDGDGTASFSGNSIETTNRGATGGGLFIKGTTVGSDNTKVVINNILFSGNSVETTGASGSGGGLTLRTGGGTFSSILIQDTSFLGNTVSAPTIGSVTGGAIHADHEITIAATTKDVLFQGNQAIYGAAKTKGTGQSIYSSTDVNYAAAAGRTIADYDGIHVLGKVTKDGDGSLALLGTNAVHTMGDLDVAKGTLESSMYNDGNGVVSSFLADNGVGGSGTVDFAAGTAWRLDLSSLNQSDIDDLEQHGVVVATQGFVDDDRAQAALERGTEMAFYGLSVDSGAIVGQRLASVNMSDIRNSALMMHRWNTVRNATSDRMDLNDYYHRNSGSYGSKEHCRANCITNSAWVNYIGRHNRLESSYYLGDDIKMTSNGIQTGVDLISNHRSQLGFMFGYEGQNNKLHSDRIKGDDYYFGLYGMRKFQSGSDFRAYFGYGFQNYDMDRYSDIAASQLNQSSFDGDVFEINLELGKRLGCDRGVSFRPVIALDYFNNKIDGASESVSNYYYDSLKLEQLYLRVGSDFQRNSGRVKFNGGLFYSIQMLGDGDSIDSNVTSGVQTLRLAGSDLGNSVLTYTLGTSIALNTEETCQLYGGYSGDIFLDRDGTPLLHNGHVGLLWRF